MLDSRRISMVEEAMLRADKYFRRLERSGALEALERFAEHQHNIERAMSTLSQVDTRLLVDVGERLADLDWAARVAQRNYDQFFAFQRQIEGIRWSALPAISTCFPQPPAITEKSHQECAGCIEKDAIIQRQDAELQYKDRVIQNLYWSVLGYGSPYPPKSWDSFDDFTDLSKN